MVKFIISALIIFVFIVFSHNLEDAFGCSCSVSNLDHALENADSVFLGKVEKIEQVKNNYEVSVNTEKFWKGSEIENITVMINSLDPNECGINFKENQSYLIFATEDETGRIQTGSCSFTMNVDNWLGSSTIFFLDTHLTFLWVIWFWIGHFVSALPSMGILLLIPITILGLVVYYIILFRKKLFSRKS